MFWHPLKVDICVLEVVPHHIAGRKEAKTVMNVGFEREGYFARFQDGVNLDFLNSGIGENGEISERKEREREGDCVFFENFLAVPML